MKKEKPELKVVVHGEVDLRKMPKDIFDLLVAALTEQIDELIKAESEKQN